MQRRWKRRALEPRFAALAIDHRHAKRGLDAHVADRTDFVEKLERLGIAAEQHVLTVVDQLAGLAIGKGRRAAAEPRTRFEDDNEGSAEGQADGGAQARESRTDDYDVNSHCLNAISA